MGSAKQENDLKVTNETVGEVPVLHVSGEIDMANAPVIEGTVETEVSNAAHGLVLDLSEVTYLDSAGVRLLYHLESRLASHQQRLVIIVPSGSVILRTLQAAGVIGSLVLCSSVEAGLTVANAVDHGGTGSNGTTG
jgi:anti-anti-sigma factor